MALGDIDGDRQTDIVLGVDGEGVRVDYGAGMFDPALPLFAKADNQPAVAAVGDMDNDGDLDLVTGNFSGGGSVFLNTSSAGMRNGRRVFDSNFGPPISFEALDRGQVSSLVLADMDADGRLDIVVGYAWSGSGQLFLNTPGATPGAPPVFPLAATFGRAGITSLAILNLDGKDGPDIIAGYRNGPGEVYAGGKTYPETLNGNPLELPRSILLNVEHITSLAVADVNGDGMLDLITGSQNGTMTIPLGEEKEKVVPKGDIRVSYGLGGGGLTSPVAVVPYDVPVPSRLAGVDIEGDPRTEILVGFHNGPLSVLAQLETGWDEEVVVPFSPTGPEVEGPTSVSAADMDGDGRVDLVAAGTRQGGPEGKSEVEFQAVFLQRRTDSAPGAAFPTEAPNCNTARPDLIRCFGNRRPLDVVPADMDADGDLDLVAIDDEQPQITILFNDGAGALGTGDPLLVDPLDTRRFDTPRIAVADLDGVGMHEIVLADIGRQGVALADIGPQAAVFLSKSYPQFETVGEASDLAIGDLDGDGRSDLVAVGLNGDARVHLNNGGPGFFDAGLALGRIKGAPGEKLQVALGRFDGDEHLDLVVTSPGEQSLVYFNRQGNGTFWSSELLPGEDGHISCDHLPAGVGCVGGPTDQITSVAAADVDGDGTTDLIAAYDDRPGRVFLGDGQGHFLSQTGDCETNAELRCFGDRLGSSSSLPLVAAGDLDRDERVDLVVAGQSGPKRIYFSDSSGRYPFSEGKSIDCFAPPANVVCFGRDTDSTFQLDLADVDGDSDLDILIGNLGPQGTVYLNDGEGQFGARRLFGAAVSYNFGLGAGDLNGDGAADLVADVDEPNVKRPDGTENRVVARIYRSRLPGTTGLPNAMPKIAIATPACNSGTRPCLVDQPVINIAYTLSDSEGDPVTMVRGLYSLDDGGSWREAIPEEGTQPITFETTLAGKPYTFRWNTFQSQFFGQSDQVVFRIEAYPGPQIASGGSYQRPYVAAQTSPFRARGAQVKVVRSDTTPAQPTSDIVLADPCPPGEECTRIYLPFTGTIGNGLAVPITRPSSEGAWVFSSPPGPQQYLGRALSSTVGVRLRTNSAGYLQGEARIGAGAGLMALQPVLQAANGKFTVYLTNSKAADDNFESPHPVQPARGVQELQVSSAAPLMLFNLTVSIEWETSPGDGYLERLKIDIERASALLYDWTNGQAAFGNVRILDGKAGWDQADIRIYASNLVRPSATIGGIADGSGHVRMGPTWNRYGEGSGGLGEDWPRALAHEMGHYAFNLNDNYLGEDDGGYLTQVTGCSGAMTDPYVEGVESEFRPPSGWKADCGKTLSQLTLQRSDWEVITATYPWMRAPGATLAGPNRLLLDVLEIKDETGGGDADLLRAPVFYVEYRETPTSLPTSIGDGARAFLYKQVDGKIVDILDLGAPVGGQVLARGATNQDRLCVFDLKSTKPSLGCPKLSARESRLTLSPVTSWPPEVIITAQLVTPGMDTASFTIQVALPAPLGSGQIVKAQYFPSDRQTTIGAPETLQPVGGTTFTTVLTGTRPLGGLVRIWIEGGGDQRELLVGFGLDGSPAMLSSSEGDAGAPVLSPDGQVTIYGRSLRFNPGEFYTFQGVNRPPAPPEWATPIGESYRLTASSPGAPSLRDTAISFLYLGRDVPPGEEEGIRIYYYPEGGCARLARGTCWQELGETRVNLGLNVASAPMRGPGIYALMSSIPIDLKQVGWNTFAYPSRVSLPVEKALRSIEGSYEIVAYVSSRDPGEPWQIYEVGNPNNTLTTLTGGRGYLISMKEPRTLLLRGGARTVATMAQASLAAQQTPPAIYRGRVEAVPGFTPQVGAEVTATIDGVICGRGTTVAAGEAIRYLVAVSAEGPGAAGCGKSGRQVRLTVAGSPLVAVVPWSDTRPLDVDLTS